VLRPQGPERKSAVISPENLKLTAYHEGGHALVALHTKGAMPINKATIVPRGDALGMVSYLPEKDQLNLTRQQMLAHIDVCMCVRSVATRARRVRRTATLVARWRWRLIGCGGG
jgi:ATP-dependent Zn protease